MYYCYACRKQKPDMHSHFVDFGILAMRPPKQTVASLRAQWQRMTPEAQSQAHAAGRQLLMQPVMEESHASSNTGMAHLARQRANTTTPAHTATLAPQTRRASAYTSTTNEPSKWELLAIPGVLISIGLLAWFTR